MTTLPENFFAVSVWSDDTKATSLTGSASGSIPFTTAPITRIAAQGIYRHLRLMDADDYKISVHLEDKVAGTLSKGNYFEVYCGHAGHQQLWFAGYVSQLMKTSAIQSSYDITGISALTFLSSYRNGDAMFASWGLGYHNVLQRFNGINPVGQGAGTNQKGVLPPTWQAVYVDGTFVPAATTTISGTVSVNTTVIPVNNSNGINITNRAVQIQHGSNFDWYGLDPTNPNPDSQHIQIVAPGTIRQYTNGDNVKMASYKLPGTGNSWFNSNDTALNALKQDCAAFNLYMRMRPGSTSRSGIVEIGPLLDASGLTIWGGTQLATQLGTADTAHSWHANVADAQKAGLAVIEEASLVDDFTKIVNCCWPFGKGKGDHARLIKTLVGGDPPGNGWATYQPAVPGRLYYIKTASATTWDGDTFEYICFQRQDGRYQYGVINRGANTGANQAPPYGLHEVTIKNRIWTQPEMVLAAGLGRIQYSADPTPTTTFKVRHPLTSVSGVPLSPVPGQSIDIRFTGEVHDATDINKTTGPTYGQQIGIGSYRYIKYPTLGDPTDENGSVPVSKVKKMSRMVEMEDTWSADGQMYEASYIMGAGHFQRKDISELLAQDMISGHHDPDPFHTFTKRKFEGVPFWMANTTPLAYEDASTNSLIMQAGSLVVSDVPDANFFDESHGVSWSFLLNDDSAALEFIFCKVIDSMLTTLTSSQLYGVFRLAGVNSGKQSGFFVTSNGVTYTQKGGFHPHGMFNAARQVKAFATVRSTIGWHQGQFVAMVSEPDFGPTNHPKKVATWHDYAVALPQFGAIGFSYVGGAYSSAITSLAATELHHPPHTLRKSVGKGQMHGGSPYSKRTGQNATQFNQGRGGIQGTGRTSTAPIH